MAFFDEPFRSAYCKLPMYGIPFDGKDYCTEDKKGGMKGVLVKAIPLFDVADSQGYRASPISWLIEGLVLNPSVLFSDYVTYDTIYNENVKVTIS